MGYSIDEYILVTRDSDSCNEKILANIIVFDESNKVVAEWIGQVGYIHHVSIYDNLNEFKRITIQNGEKLLLIRTVGKVEFEKSIVQI